MRVYLTGPADGDFVDAARLLRTAGYVVQSPHELPGGLDLRAQLTWATEGVLNADVLVALPGWQVGSAADVELTLAAAVSTPVVALDDALAREPELLLV